MSAGSPGGEYWDIGRLLIPLSILTLLGACGISLVATRAGAAHRNTDVGARSHGLVYAGLRQAGTGPCKGVYMLGSACTHGPDPAPPGVDVRRRATLTELRERARAARRKTGVAAALPCSGKAPFSVQAIYAHLQGTPDKLATYRPLFEQYAQDIEWVFHASAAETGGERAVRFVTGEGCTLDIESVSLTATASKNMAKMQTELKAGGFNAHDRILRLDGRLRHVGVVGTYYPDPRPEQSIFNNGNTNSQLPHVSTSRVGAYWEPTARSCRGT